MNRLIRPLRMASVFALLLPGLLAARPWPDSSSRVQVFADQLQNSLSEAQRQFAATRLAGTQKMTRTDIRAIRAYNADFLCLHYQLAVGCGPELFLVGDDWVSDWSHVNAQTSWFLLNGGSRVHQTAWNWDVMDITYAGGTPNTGFPQYWLTNVLARIATNEDDAVFADSFTQDAYAFGQCSPSHPWFEDVGECLANWVPNLQTFGRAMKAAFDADGRGFLYLPNLGALITSWDTTDFGLGHGGMIEGFCYWGTGSYFDDADWELQMTRALGLTRSNQVVICQSSPDTGAYTDRLFALASYLLIKGSRTYLNLLTTGDVALEYYPEYEVNLGGATAPLPSSLSSFWHSSWNVYRRDFSNGMALVNHTGGLRTVSNLGGYYYLVSPSGGGAVNSAGSTGGTLSYIRTNAVTLAAHSGAILLTSTNVSPAGPAPAQPADLAATHQSGQSFITWTERAELSGESYRVYRHTAPITSANIGQATRLYTVPKGSANFYASRYNVDSSGTWAYRYSERLVIANRGAALASGTGLLVWTLATNEFSGGTTGAAYYAVTSLNSEGQENMSDFAAGNTLGPLAEGVADPLPVELNVNAGPRGHVYIQYMDLRNWNPTFHAPHAGNLYYGLNALDPAVSQAIQYAYDYVVYEPEGSGSGAAPAYMNLHGWGGNTYGPYTEDPEAYNWPAYKIYPTDQSETWYFGFARAHDYRQSLVVPAGDAIVNYTEQRLLRMVYDLMRSPPGRTVDPNRIFVWGHSMGGSGALALALRYPSVFAAAYASEPMTDYLNSTWAADMVLPWGASALNLPIHLSAPNHWADPLQACNTTGVWTWQNHQSNLVTRLADDSVPFGIAHGMNDHVIEWTTQGRPVQAKLNASKRMYGATVTASDHTWQNFEGLPPNLAPDASLVPFQNFSVVKNESVPGLANGSANNAIPPTTTGGYNLAIEWSSSWNAFDGLPLDSSRYWQISLRSTSGENQTVDVTPRRLQVFRLTPGALVSWQNIPAGSSAPIQSGTLTADLYGMVTVPGFLVSAGGNRLRLDKQDPPVITGPVVNDYNGDQVSDYAVYGAADGKWYILSPSGTPLAFGASWGGAGLATVPGDYDGDRKAELAVYSQALGKWYIQALGGSVLAWDVSWGGAGMISVSGDFDGDNRSDLAVFSQNNGGWYVYSLTGAVPVWGTLFGGPGFTPVSGDFNGDGVSDLAVYHQASGTWYVSTVAGAILAWGTAFGGPGFTPVSGDFNGDGVSDLAVYNESLGAWFISTLSGTIFVWSASWGGAGFTALSGDFDADGISDLVVYNASSGAWYIRTVSNTVLVWALSWGGPGLDAVRE